MKDKLAIESRCTRCRWNEIYAKALETACFQGQSCVIAMSDPIFLHSSTSNNKIHARRFSYFRCVYRIQYTSPSSTSTISKTHAHSKLLHACDRLCEMSGMHFTCVYMENCVQEGSSLSDSIFKVLRAGLCASSIIKTFDIVYFKIYYHFHFFNIIIRYWLNLYNGKIIFRKKKCFFLFSTINRAIAYKYYSTYSRCLINQKYKHALLFFYVYFSRPRRCRKAQKKNAI